MVNPLLSTKVKFFEKHWTSVMYLAIPLIIFFMLSYQRSPNCFSERPTTILALLRLLSIFTVAMLLVISISELLLSSKPGVSMMTILFLLQLPQRYETFAHRVSDIVLLLTLSFLAISGFFGRKSPVSAATNSYPESPTIKVVFPTPVCPIITMASASIHYLRD